MSARPINRQIVVVQRPRYTIPTTNVFRLKVEEQPKVGAGQVRVRTTWLGLDAHLYRRVKGGDLADAVPLGGVMVGPTVGRVETSNASRFKEGDIVHGAWGWQDWYVSDGSDLEHVDPALPRPSYQLGAFGESGFGAYVTVNVLLRVQKGETLILGAGIGGLGQMIGQMAKQKGAIVLAGAGSPEKCRYALDTFGYDVCLDRTSPNFELSVRAVYAKYGVDTYSMTYGGKVLEWALPYFKPRARVAVCGIMTLYAQSRLPTGPDKSMLIFDQIQRRGIQVRGLVVEEWKDTALYPEFKREMREWILGKKIMPLEHVVDGLEQAPDTLQGLFEGRNFGKAVIRVGD